MTNLVETTTSFLYGPNTHYNWLFSVWYTNEVIQALNTNRLLQIVKIVTSNSLYHCIFRCRLRRNIQQIFKVVTSKFFVTTAFFMSSAFWTFGRLRGFFACVGWASRGAFILFSDFSSVTTTVDCYCGSDELIVAFRLLTDAARVSSGCNNVAKATLQWMS